MSEINERLENILSVLSGGKVISLKGCKSFVLELSKIGEVALVGGSPNIIGKKLGGEIDKCDIVIRINNGNCSGRMEDLGSKTNLRFVFFNLRNKDFDFFNSLDRNELIITKSKNVEILEFLGFKNVFSFDFNLNREALRMIVGFLGLDKSLLRNLPPRTGFSIIVLLYILSDFCLKLNLYGFDFEKKEKYLKNIWDDKSISTSRYEKYHMPMDLELDLLNSFIERVNNEF